MNLISLFILILNSRAFEYFKESVFTGQTELKYILMSQLTRATFKIFNYLFWPIYAECFMHLYWFNIVTYIIYRIEILIYW